MEKYLYQDLYTLEESHWWHKAKRASITSIIKNNFLNTNKLQILDVGCGTGKNLEELLSFGKVYGIDSSSDAIRFCKKRILTNIYLRHSHQTKFKNNYFDIVLLLDVLEHVDENPTLKEIHRILKPNGILILTVPAYQWLWSQWDVVLHHKRRYQYHQLKHVLTRNKLNPNCIFFKYSFLVPIVLIVRIVKSRLHKTNSYTSDFQINSRFLNILLLNLAKFEAFIGQFIPIPFGTSIVAVCNKNGKIVK